MATPGELFIVSSPSGGGKTTIIRGVMEDLRWKGRDAHFSVSHTTRAPREGERDGVDYHFVERAAFRRMIEGHEFLEFAEVHGNLYGTSRREVGDRLERGCDVFLDIDVQGARQVRASVPAAIKVFIFPPSCGELRRRLVARRQDAPEVIELRIQNALREMREYAEFDYVIINDRLEQAICDLAQVVATSRLRPRSMQASVQPIIDSFASALEEE